MNIRRCRRQTVGVWRCTRVSGGTGGRLLAQDSEKNLCDDPFQTVPGSIPGSCIPAFTGTHCALSVCRQVQQMIKSAVLQLYSSRPE